ncbi:MAG: hypothetical protein QOI08_4094 [Actinomycetota bacterium]|nr:hypothetical protein [Actinomycetota bacterium]
MGIKTGRGRPLIVAPPGESWSAGAGHEGASATVMLAVSVAPGTCALPATKGRGCGCGSAYSEPPDNSGDCVQTTARPGARSGTPDALSVLTTSRLRGGAPGIGSGTGPTSVTTIVSCPSRKGWPNRAVLGSTATLVGTFCVVDVEVWLCPLLAPPHAASIATKIVAQSPVLVDGGTVEVFLRRLGTDERGFRANGHGFDSTA